MFAISTQSAQPRRAYRHTSVIAEFRKLQSIKCTIASQQ
jgi:hypothetical protein